MTSSPVRPHRHFVTHSDHRYLPKAQVLHASLKRHHARFTLWVVCTSDEAEARVRAIADESLRPVSLAAVEQALPELRTAKQNRCLVEYCYTLSPAVVRYVMEHSNADLVTYLDADMMFFASPELALEQLADASICITPHKFSFFVRHARKGGEFNVGWVSFRRDVNGLEALHWWYDRCIEWCYQRYEDGKYADQAYLNRFPELFKGVKILDDPGVNLAPWNMANYRIAGTDHGVTVNGRPLVFFHFADFVQVSRWHYSVNTSSAMIWLTPKLRRLLFRPYIQALRAASPEGLPHGLRGMRTRDFLSPRQIARLARKIFFMQYVFVLGTCVV